MLQIAKPRRNFINDTRPFVLALGAIFVLGAAPLHAQLGDLFGLGAASRTQAMNNLKQHGLAMHNYHDTYRFFPSPVGAKTDDAKPLLSWRVAILPYLEETALYEQFKRDEPWDSDHNKKLIARMPKVYQAPGSKVAKEFKTNYLLVRGKKTAFELNGPVKMSSIKDGLSNTLLIVEASDENAVVWTKPDDYEVNLEKPLAGLLGLRGRGFLAACGDGSVRFLDEKTPTATLQALFTSNGGETVSLK